MTLTAPSVVFSTGTTPKAARPRSTSSKTSTIVRTGRKSTAAPKCVMAAWWVKVACGPKYATVRGPSSARDADRISRQIAARLSAVSGPRFCADNDLKISASRSGTYDGVPCRRLRWPI